ncbi:exodeoxyribonuclease V subunit gamma [Ornithinimicrobium sp. W1665]|uniref:exodeoxyribonuclease V subunit gamma n=1 Tax=Ornithinimicrobium sp. W1665 TaxID=3416666 RepID=UPI003CF649BC
MTLIVHRAAGTGVLADGLAELLGSPLEDPFAEEVVAVPARGVERWLAQRLSHRLGAGPSGHDGVCAGVRFLSPHSLVTMVLGVERDDPWRPGQLAWAVLRAVDESLGEPWATTLADHLGYAETGTERELRQGRRYAVARRLAGLFADYAAQRPAVLTDWRAGGDGDGLGGRVADDLAWQPPLWRRVLEVVGSEAPDERHARAVEALRAGRLTGLELPGRLSLFGHTRISRSEVEVLGALAEHRDVHLWLPQASPAAWEELAPTVAVGPVPRDEDRSGELVQHPLLASLGRDARELQRTLALTGGREELVGPPPPGGATGASGASGLAASAGGAGAGAEGGTGGDGTEAGSDDEVSLLAMLQHDVRADRAPDRATRAGRQVPADDRSVQVHACHGQSRQVEVLRDVLADLLERDPTLEPRDILVMCPDIDAYAPLVHAGFGLGEVVRDGATRTHPAHGLRVRLADRAPVHLNPLLRLALHLTELAGGRVTAGEVLDLARSAPVRHRFGFDDDALERIGDWVGATTVRWGLDGEHRADYQLRNVVQNTWRAGLDRILVGASVDGQDVDHVGRTLGLDDLDSGDLDLAGRLAELVERLGRTLRGLRTADTAGQWLRVVEEGVLDLADVPFKDAWQVAQLERELRRTAEAAGRVAGGGGVSLSLADVHALLTEQTAGRATRSNFRTGTLTVCTMVPMRSVPHRVVALVGMDDGDFPRSTTPDGDDVLARRPVTGERDPRSEDRQLLLDALMSAGETFVVTYTGFDEHTGQTRPPAVPLGELVDALRVTATGEGVERVLTEHPLQPYDLRNLGRTPDGTVPLLPDDAPFSYDPSALAGARALRERPTEPVPLARRTFAPWPREDVLLDDLVRFFDNPAKAFLRSRIGLYVPEVPELRGEGIPVELDGLQRWVIGERMLTAVLAGRDASATCEAELWRGELPPDALGHRTMEQLTGQVQELCQATWRAVGQGGWGQALDRESLDVDIALPLPDHRRLVGTLAGLVGESALTVSFSSVKAKHRLHSWIYALVLAAAGQEHARSHHLGRYSFGRVKGVGHVSHGPLPQELALQTLGQLVDLRDRGLDAVLPLPVETSRAWAEQYLKNRSVRAADERAAQRGWQTQQGGWGIRQEQHDTSWQHVLGDVLPLQDVVGTPLDDERWVPDVPHRLGQLSLRLWEPLLTGHETLERG